jgi:hypothetical protein
VCDAECSVIPMIQKELLSLFNPVLPLDDLPVRGSKQLTKQFDFSFLLENFLLFGMISDKKQSIMNYNFDNWCNLNYF